ncbi:MAG: ferritin-like domain-containing protein [Bacillota bacterium]|nr:ferritin-like domain-containing protein [Negativicutes bacterium]
MKHGLVRLIGEYTADEWHDYLYYTQVAEKTKTDEQREMVLEFARDEYRHAVALARYYWQLTGTYPYIAPYQPKPLDKNLEKVFMSRVKPESADLKKYKELYLMTPDPQLRDIAFNAMNDEAQHAIRLLYLAEGAD